MLKNSHAACANGFSRWEAFRVKRERWVGFLLIVKNRGGENRTDTSKFPACTRRSLANGAPGGPNVFSQGVQPPLPVTSYNTK